MENLMNEGLENLMETEVVEEAIDVVEDVIETTGVNKYAKVGIAAVAIGVTAYGVKKFIDWRKAKKNDNVIEVEFTKCDGEYPEVNEEE